jgi:hypothetical protein
LQPPRPLLTVANVRQIQSQGGKPVQAFNLSPEVIRIAMMILRPLLAEDFANRSHGIIQFDVRFGRLAHQKPSVRKPPSLADPGCPAGVTTLKADRRVWTGRAVRTEATKSRHPDPNLELSLRRNR